MQNKRGDGMKAYICDVCQMARTKDLSDIQFNECGGWLKIKASQYEMFCDNQYGKTPICTKKTLHICPKCQ